MSADGRDANCYQLCCRAAACVVAMEVSCGAHHMGRALARQGHAVWLMSPEYVRPYVWRVLRHGRNYVRQPEQRHLPPPYSQPL
jgi:transposase